MNRRAQHSISTLALAIVVGAAGTASAATLTGDYGGADVTASTGDVIEGSITNVGTFRVPAGVTVSLSPTGAASIEASRIEVFGEIDGVGKGFAGGKAANQASGTAGQGPGGGAGGVAQQCAHPTGGGGGGYGSIGGAGRNSLNVVFAPGGNAYGDPTSFLDVQRGSGGGGGGSFLCSLNGVGGAGGAGGGAIELRAPQVVISGTIAVDGAPGRDANPSAVSAGTSGGGGGAAGTIVMIGNSISLSGVLSARGGNGGDILADPTQTFAGGGGGGAGGLIKIQWRDTFDDVGTVAATGGAGGLSGILGGPVISDDGDDGVLEIVRENLAPVAQNISVTTDEDVAVPVVLSASDPNGDPLTYQVAAPSNGVLSGTPPSLVYEPSAGFSGADSFSYSVADPAGLRSNQATVSVVILPVNDAPVVADTSISTPEDTARDFVVAANDPDGDPLSFVTSTPSNGRVVPLGGNAFRYEPNANFHGADAFDVTVSDGSASASATVDVTVTPVNDPPVALDAPVTTDEEISVNVALVASDVDGDSLTYTISTPGRGTVVGQNGPTFTYVPAPNDTGDVVFGYTVSDGIATAGASITVRINGTNDPPQIVDLQLTVDEDSTVSQAITATDPDGDSLQFSASEPLHGTATIVGARLTYTPTPNYHGTDTFQVTASDGVLTATARVSVTVEPVNDPPTAVDVSAFTAEDVPATVTLSGSDIDGDPLIFVAENPAEGTVDLTGATATFTPPPNANGTFTFTYRANDGTVDSAPATVTIEVGPENDPPEWTSSTPDDLTLFDVVEGATVAFVLEATDPDGELLTYDVQPLPPGASFDAVSGAFTWTPEWTDAGEITHTLSATDGASTIVRVVTIRVTVPDTDGDGVPDTRETELGLNPLEPDSDTDGIDDKYELTDPLSPFDTDRDGIIDALDEDSDGDGLIDRDEAGDDDLATPPVDRDGDGLPDFRDLDSDADEIDDAIDNCPTVPNADQVDADRDGFGDLCDNDTDGDGLADALELQYGFDPGDIDSDNDFIGDFVEFGFGLSASDVDGDGVPDGLDEDSDDDGILDSIEAGDDQLFTPPSDTDFDGRPDFRDRDSDADTVLDGIDNCRIVFNTDQADIDGNGIGDACDGDSDGDGVPNEVDNCRLVPNPEQADFDGDSLGDLCDEAPGFIAPEDGLPGPAPAELGGVVDPVEPIELQDEVFEGDGDEANPFANSYFGGAGGCSSAESNPSFPVFFFLLALVAIGRRRGEKFVTRCSRSV